MVQMRNLNKTLLIKQQIQNVMFLFHGMSVMKPLTDLFPLCKNYFFFIQFVYLNVKKCLSHLVVMRWPK